MRAAAKGPKRGTHPKPEGSAGTPWAIPPRNVANENTPWLAKSRLSSPGVAPLDRTERFKILLDVEP
jgi:hypothetical protein